MQYEGKTWRRAHLLSYPKKLPLVTFHIVLEKEPHIEYFLTTKNHHGAQLTTFLVLNKMAYTVSSVQQHILWNHRYIQLRGVYDLLNNLQYPGEVRFAAASP